MRLFVSLLFLFILYTTEAFATTWYLRTDGGTYGTTSTTCNGLYDVAYSAGNGPNCAVKDPYEIMSWNGGGTMRITQGDVLYFSKASDAMPIGLDRSAVKSGCSVSYPYDCTLSALPNNITIRGYGWDTGCAKATRVSLYSREGVAWIFYAENVENLTVQCLDITDHSDCGFRVGDHTCSESWSGGVGDQGRNGLEIRAGTNVVLKDLFIHGMAYQGLHMGGINGVTMNNVHLWGNHFMNWDGDTVGVDSFSGDIRVTNSTFRFSGCAEAYPPSANFTTADYDDCDNQNAADGAGFNNTAGNWYFKNTEFSHNSSDGLDLLYCSGCNVSIDKSLFEGNWGNQFKVHAVNLDVTNSVFIANCGYLYYAGKAAAASTIDASCRAVGTPISALSQSGGTWELYNNFFYSATRTSGSAAIEFDYNSGCTGSETYYFKNNISYSPNHTWYHIYNAMTGACQTALNNAVTQYNNIYNFQDNPTGTGNVYTDPTLSGTFSNTADTNISVAYITASSPGKGAGVSGISYWNNSNDFNNFTQNSPVDMGALQYNSVDTCYVNNDICAVGSDCCSGYCSPLNLCYTPGSYLYNITPIGSIKFQ